MDWSELPSVVILDVFKYLGTNDRLNASSTCANWRSSVFQMPLNETLDLVLQNFESDSDKYQFLAECFAHKVTHISLTFDAASSNCMDLVCETLTNLERNASLKSLKLVCTEESVGKCMFSQQLQMYFTNNIIQPLLRLLSGRNYLETFSFPIIEPFLHQQLQVLETLANSPYNKYTLRNLVLTTIRTAELFRFGPVERGRANLVAPIRISAIMPHLFNAFYRLQVLSVDHDILTDDILATLAKGSQSGGLTQLNLVAVKRNPYMSNRGWTDFVVNNPNCKVRLTVMGASALVDRNSNLCFPSTPLTHFRALYCQQIRINMLNDIILWNLSRLEHLELVNENQDWLENVIQSANQLGEDFIDPFIFAAWRVNTLRTIKIGYLYCGHDIIGVAKLGIGHLNRLEIPKSQILHKNIENLCAEVSHALGKPWAPIDDGFGPGKSRSQILQRRMSSSFQAVVLNENY